MSISITIRIIIKLFLREKEVSELNKLSTRWRVPPRKLQTVQKQLKREEQSYMYNQYRYKYQVLQIKCHMKSNQCPFSLDLNVEKHVVSTYNVEVFNYASIICCCSQ